MKLEMETRELFTAFSIFAVALLCLVVGKCWGEWIQLEEQRARLAAIHKTNFTPVVSKVRRRR